MCGRRHPFNVKADVSSLAGWCVLKSTARRPIGDRCMQTAVCACLAAQHVCLSSLMEFELVNYLNSDNFVHVLKHFFRLFATFFDYQLRQHHRARFFYNVVRIIFCLNHSAN